MKKELQQKQIITYLPYKVEAVARNDVFPVEIEGIDLHTNEVIIERVSTPIKDIKLILKPLTDLWKDENEEDRDELSELEIYHLEGTLVCAQVGLMPIDGTLVRNINHEAVISLVKKHYDIYNLLKTGGAVTIEELRQLL